MYSKMDCVCKLLRYRYTRLMNSEAVCYGLVPPRRMFELDGGQRVTHGVSLALQSLESAALSAGFKLGVVSGYRDCARQAHIVSAKWQGTRPIYDDHNIPVLDEPSLARVKAILRFSALPGASRHHWGTDIDVVDQRVLEKGHQLDLTPSEYSSTGVFAEFSEWLTTSAQSHGFGFPYAVDRGFVSPEPWHLSFIDEADEVFKGWHYDQWLELLGSNLPADLVALIESHHDQLQGYVASSMRFMHDV